MAHGLIGVLMSFWVTPAFCFRVYGDTGVVLCETLFALSLASKFDSLACNTCGEGEAIAFLGDGLDGSTNGRFWVETFPFGRCLGATLVPSSA